MVELRKAVLLLTLFLVLSASLNIVQFLSGLHSSSGEGKYVFSFNNAPNIKNGTLTINVKQMDWQPEKIVMKVIVDDDGGGSYLGVAFDTDGDGRCIGEPAFCLGVDNKTWNTTCYVGLSGKLEFPSVGPKPSPYHTCTFVEGVGYIFNIELPREIKLRLAYEEITLPINPPVLTHLVYFGVTEVKVGWVKTGHVSVEFMSDAL